MPDHSGSAQLPSDQLRTQSGSRLIRCAPAFAFGRTKSLGRSLRKLHIESVDFLGADVARRQDRTVWRDSRHKPKDPDAKAASRSHIGNVLELTVGEADAVFRVLENVLRIEVNAFAVRRPGGVSHFKRLRLGRAAARCEEKKSYNLSPSSSRGIATDTVRRATRPRRREALATAARRSPDAS